MKILEDLKEKAVFLGCITGLLFLIALIWILTQPIQKQYLLKTVNSVLIETGDSRRLAESAPGNSENRNLLGYWYLLQNSTDKMFVFAVFQDGILVPLGAVVSDNGNVNEIIPLSAHAVQIMDNFPQSILQIYKTRIETAALVTIEGRSR